MSCMFFIQSYMYVLYMYFSVSHAKCGNLLLDKEGSEFMLCYTDARNKLHPALCHDRHIHHRRVNTWPVATCLCCQHQCKLFRT